MQHLDLARLQEAVITYQPHVRLSFSGTLGTSLPAPERFTFTMSIDRPADLTQAQNDAVAAAGVALFADASWHTNPWAILTEVKSKAITAAGLYVAGPPLITMVNQAGSAQGSNHPPQVACVVSLGTAVRGVRGRFYMPAPSNSVDGGSLEQNEPQTTSYLASVTTFLTAVNGAAGGGLGNANGLCVASRKGLGVNAVVTEYRVGRALDTMRSRRRSLKENYSSHPV